ncbi:hypothetical protein L4174_020415 [Photobacterium sp. CCB-ST2H9]|uniref:hypothetical protein n=1 Tax=Photobacterium sp. CCB-ST2H9 TaxID=2912855 RepID=UPI00200385B7|nr:hypothetical protein [Photobacterium sp. CCB-ST2H9]UTM59079.1 hypothetical protein L4174_020415 [Photobacterium sp. CCB-ST2H9]
MNDKFFANMIIPVFILFAASVVSFQTSAQAQQSCDEATLLVIQADYVQHKNSQSTRTDFSSLACKTLPNQPNLTLSSYIMRDGSGEYGDMFLWRVILIENKKSVIADYESFFSNDEGGIRIEEDQIWLDTARYHLNKATRAFGVRLAIGHSSRYAEGGWNDYLTLFVREQDKLKPVLANFSMSYWVFKDGYPGDSVQNKPVWIEATKIILGIENTMTNGFRDIKVNSKIQKKKSGELHLDNFYSERTETQIMKFNGTQYVGYDQWK